MADSPEAIGARRMLFQDCSTRQYLLAGARNHAIAHDLVSRRIIGFLLTGGRRIRDTEVDSVSFVVSGWASCDGGAASSRKPEPTTKAGPSPVRNQKLCVVLWSRSPEQEEHYYVCIVAGAESRNFMLGTE